MLLFDGFSLSKYQAEDVVAEFFADIWNNRSERQIDAFRPYSYTSVRNASLKQLNRLQRKVRWEGAVHSISSTSEESSDTGIIQSEEQQELYAIVEKLPEMQRRVLLLKKMDGLRYKEISAILGISVHTVQNHMVAAVKSLGKAISSSKKIQP